MTASPLPRSPLSSPSSPMPNGALAGFLDGYRGLTREACALDLRQFTTLVPEPLPRLVRSPACRHRELRLGAGGRARVTVTWDERGTTLPGHPAPG
jgi:hypothetical protein